MMNENQALLTLEPTPPLTRRRRRWPWIAASAAVVAAGGITAGFLLTGGQAPVTPACQRAVAAQDKFVGEAVALGYPGVDPGTALGIIAADLKLIHDVQNAGCPRDLQVEVLPGG